MTEITYRRATPDDVEALATLRWEMAVEREPAAEGGASREDYIAAFAETMRGELARGTHVAWLAEAAGEPVACAWLIWWTMPPTPAYLRRRRGFVSSVYTRPAYRRQGVARQIIERLIAYARQTNVQRLILWASEMGRPLYEDLGFTPSRGLELNVPPEP